MKKCEFCGQDESMIQIHLHHVVGRVGKDKNKPENLFYLCAWCHYLWHNNRSVSMERRIYREMKRRYGDAFPVKVNGKPYKTKWIMREEARDGNNRED